ncbi:MAG: bifunctional UDP-N-acetylglucosamine diphosphorylase/glucosamine-1-phosphate N-acetyltransferase GlmU [Nitrospirae bacterium]|nr:bifunctional UDP-N-acetylglucosamine diphosphorylase/glucosamine-1-phosphate N-acetyltransferase GlmU [Nitrospirota bacterium]
MKNTGLAAVILSAGLGKRMKSNLAKVLHPVAGKPMVVYPVEAARQAAVDRIIVVAGHQAEKVKEVLEPLQVEVVLQPEQKGTADAVSCAVKVLKGFRGDLLVLCGDTPLLRPETLAGLVQRHRKGNNPVTVLTTVVPDPAGYGHVVRRPDGSVLRIVEDKDASEAVRSIREINTGIYVFDVPYLTEVLSEIRPENAQKEFYLTDTVEIAVRRGLYVQGVVGEDPDEFLGINARTELAVAERLMRLRINARHMGNGVTFLSPETTLIEADVAIGQDVVLYPNTVLQGRTKIGPGTTIYPNNRIVDSELGRDVSIQDGCLIESSRIGDHSVVGPFAHLRPGSVLEKKVKVGNFVELKKCRMGEGSKANHLTYLGDAEIGKDVNIGAGTITCNYDGIHKHQTRIDDGVFVGSDVQFVAPVTVGRGAFVAAGTTVTRDIPEGALAIGRTNQVNKKDWAKKRRRKEKGK